MSLRSPVATGVAGEAEPVAHVPIDMVFVKTRLIKRAFSETIVARAIGTHL